jgi:hypothetical protein
MSKKSLIAQILAILAVFCCSAHGLPSVDGKIFGIYPLTNEVSFYKNVDDSGNNRGETLQIISINSFKIWTEFIFEFTGDFNWDMSLNENNQFKGKDHYIELSLVKPVFWQISINYQRIISTFETEPVNQFGFRISF